MTEVTQNNLHLLLPSKVSWLADMLCAEKHISVIEAMRQIYSSDMYKQLEQESTKRWHEGPVALYQEWMKKYGNRTLAYNAILNMSGNGLCVAGLIINYE